MKKCYHQFGKSTPVKKLNLTNAPLVIESQMSYNMHNPIGRYGMMLIII